MHYRAAREIDGLYPGTGIPDSVVLALEAGDGACSLRISDDGIGLDANGSEKKGMGLSIMRYRARMIGGSLGIQPNLPTGTVVMCTIEGSTNQPAISEPSAHE